MAAIATYEWARAPSSELRAYGGQKAGVRPGTYFCELVWTPILQNDTGNFCGFTRLVYPYPEIL